MGYAIWRYAGVIGYAWALGLLLDFLPALFLYFKALAVDTIKRKEEDENKKRLEDQAREDQRRLTKSKEEQARMRQERKLVEAKSAARGTP